MMSRLEQITHLTPFKAFTDEMIPDQIAHLEEEFLYRAGGHRYICSVLGALYEQIRPMQRPELERLILEVTWMARRMNKNGCVQAEMIGGD